MTTIIKMAKNWKVVLELDKNISLLNPSIKSDVPLQKYSCCIFKFK